MVKQATANQKNSNRHSKYSLATHNPMRQPFRVKAEKAIRLTEDYDQTSAVRLARLVKRTLTNHSSNHRQQWNTIKR